ncbi:DUF6048 family protein [Fulvivirga lutea]|uniref:DUF3575 domain-containing protein n=1 Tax=Fulvivirga lutea TaxID=2810512 RepID=A0A974WH59_9BACT|nr:DUF6048 family protein [Fulvivirga lutea]QSE97037.1 hypothetical protein JR347_15795 [Fulvivirga lutea]
MKQNLQHTFNLALLLLALPLASYSQDSLRLAKPDSIRTVRVLQATDSAQLQNKSTTDTAKVELTKAAEQEQANKSKAKKEKLPKSDTARIKITSGPQIYIDYGKLLTLPSEFEQKFEIGLAYQFKNRFQPNFHFGIATIQPDAAIENGEYTSEGSYWRAGVNYLVPLDQINRLFIGVRYAQSEFNDSGSYEITSELWPTFTESFERDGFAADWFELVLGSEKMFKNGHLLLGGEAGVRFINEKDEAEFIDIYTIPGYGLTSNQSSPFINLYVKYQF